MPTVPVLGSDVYYARKASRAAAGPPFVFVHGAGGSHQQWLYQVRDLRQVACYAPDLPGHGRSEGRAPNSVAAYAGWLAAFLDGVGLERAVVVGHSLGGAVALTAALRYPGRVAGLGLVGAGARLRVAPAYLEGIRHDYLAAVNVICDALYCPQTPREMVELGKRQMAETQPEVLYGDFAAADAFDVIGQLEAIEAPTAVICGTEDRMTPLKYAAYLRDHIPGAVLHLIDGAGHMPMLEQPAAVTAALAALSLRTSSPVPEPHGRDG